MATGQREFEGPCVRKRYTGFVRYDCFIVVFCRDLQLKIQTKPGQGSGEKGEAEHRSPACALCSPMLECNKSDWRAMYNAGSLGTDIARRQFP